MLSLTSTSSHFPLHIHPLIISHNFLFCYKFLFPSTTSNDGLATSFVKSQWLIYYTLAILTWLLHVHAGIPPSTPYMCIHLCSYQPHFTPCTNTHMCTHTHDTTLLFLFITFKTRVMEMQYWEVSTTAFSLPMQCPCLSGTCRKWHNVMW